MGYTHGTCWTEEKVEAGILNVIKDLNINRMPTRSEIFSLRQNDPLHNGIARYGGYDYWAKKLGLQVKVSESSLGWKYEDIAMDILSCKGYSVSKSTRRSPYDLLVNDHIKIDVKVGSAWLLRGSRVHTFGINKINPVCDLYLIFALDESKEVERTFIIPSIELRVVSMCIGKESKYNKFLDRWDYIDKYDYFYKSLKVV